MKKSLLFLVLFFIFSVNFNLLAQNNNVFYSKAVVKKYGQKQIDELKKLEKPDSASGLEKGINKSIPESQYPHALMYRKMIIDKIGQKAWNQIKNMEKNRLQEYISSKEYQQQKEALKKFLSIKK